MKNDGWIYPIADVTPIHEHDYSTYPEIVRIPMEDGKVVDYYVDVKLPHPAFQMVMNLLKKIPYGPSEMGYKARHIKK